MCYEDWILDWKASTETSLKSFKNTSTSQQTTTSKASNKLLKLNESRLIRSFVVIYNYHAYSASTAEVFIQFEIDGLKIHLVFLTCFRLA